jgi:hypothetical protein
MEYVIAVKIILIVPMIVLLQLVIVEMVAATLAKTIPTALMTAI